MHIPPHLVEEVRNRTDIISVISSYVELKKKGNNYWGLSPFKTEKTPSFSVNPTKKIFKCFSTGVGGDVFSFLMEKEGFHFPEAVKHCADLAGIEISESPAQQKKRKEVESYWTINQWAATWFHAHRESAGFDQRGLLPPIQKEFELGYSPDSWDQLTTAAQANGFSGEKLVQLGLVSPKKDQSGYVDRFRNRAMFPIHDLYGHVAGFGGRRAGEDKNTPKYINSPESESYQKSQLLYGLYHAKDSIREQDFCILVEGYTDVLAMVQAGFRNVVASCGTAITSSHINLIQRFTQSLILILDGDEAGQLAAEKTIKAALAEGMTVRLVTLPEGEDPDSFIRGAGRGSGQAMQTRLARAEDWLPWLVNHVGYSNELPGSDRAKIVIDLMKTIKAIPFELAQDLYVDEVEKLTGVRKSTLLNELGRQEDDELESPKAKRRRDYDYYDRLRKSLHIDSCVDFQRGTKGEVLVDYYNLNGKKYVEGKDRQHVVRNITRKEFRYGAYLPKKFRKAIDNGIEPDGVKVYVVQDEITAHILCEIGLMAIGISHKDAFLNRSRGRKLHPIFQQLVVAGFRRYVFLSPGDLFDLPEVKRKASEKPYKSTDARALADDWVQTLLAMKERFEESAVNFVYPDLKGKVIPREEKNWVEAFLLLTMGQDPKPINQYFIDLLHKANGGVLLNLPVSDRNQATFKKLLYLDDPQRFFDFHGIEKLGDEFQWEKVIYEVDRSGLVKLIKESLEQQVIQEQDGRYWARRKGDGRIPITDFLLHGVLKIRGVEPYVLAQIEDLMGKTHDLVLDGKLILNSDQFHLRVFGLADCFFHGTNSELRHLQQMTLKNMQQAYLLDQLGHTKLRTGSGKIEVFVMGNGIITYDDGFIGVDEKGLVQYGGETFFLPAESEYKLSDDQDEIYRTHLNMAYQGSDVAWEEWIDLLFKVHQPLQAHFGLAFTIMSLFRDIVYEQTKKIPNAYFQGPTGCGKTTLKDSLGKILGELPTVNVANNPTVATIGSFPLQVTNAWVALEEFNVFKMSQQRQEFIIEMAKAVYDGGTRTTRQNAHSERLKNKPARSCLICLGQEAFYQTDEAIPNRFVIREWTKRSFDVKAKQLKNDLDMLEARGVSHFSEFLLSQRNTIKATFGEKLLKTEQKLKEKIITSSNEDVLDRLIQNWAMLLTPLLMLIREGVISYPLSIKEIIDDAVKSIIDHAKKSRQLGIMGEFLGFIEAEYGSTLDHTMVFVYKPQNQLRIRYKLVYPKFKEWLNRRGDKSIIDPGKKHIREKLMEMPAFKGETTSYMGYVTDKDGRLKYTNPETEGGKPKVIYDKQHCMTFALEEIGIKLREIDFGEDFQEGEDPEKEEAKDRSNNMVGSLTRNSKSTLFSESSGTKSKAYDL